MSCSTFNSHFNMIGLNEPVQRKATFWSSYVRALKGTEDIRANDNSLKRNRELSQQPPALRVARPFEQSPDLYPRIFDDIPNSFGNSGGGGDASSRIRAPGYQYLPVSREIYGSGPRSHGSAYNTLPAPSRPRSALSRSRY